ncbi:MAG: galactosyldiacylglycerol synthase [Chloroflexi bacterium]|nr:galactosyldiacylglycerol synthase [Chloroflexota bacterium]
MSHMLLLHASVGMGHYRAATALAHAFAATSGITAQVEDTLDHAHRLFSTVYAGLYLGIADRIPAFWSQFYQQTDRPPSMFDLVAGVRALSTTLGVRGLPALIKRSGPDAILCTHFLPVEVLGPLRLQGLLPPLYCVVTDFRAHQFWACPGVDGYFVPTDATADQLVSAGIPRTHVHVMGIPINPEVTQPVDRAAVHRVLGLAPARPLVLLNGSGIAVARIRAIAEELLARNINATLVVAAGRNRELVAALADLHGTARTALHVLGPQPTLDPLIATSAVVVGKAGGLTVSEILGRGVPLIIPTPVPGQEQANADHVVAAGAGLCADSVVGVADAVMMVLQDNNRRRAMADAARSLGRPAAATLIASRVLSDLSSDLRPVRLRPSGVWASSSLHPATAAAERKDTSYA